MSLGESISWHEKKREIILSMEIICFIVEIMLLLFHLNIPSAFLNLKLYNRNKKKTML